MNQLLNSRVRVPLLKDILKKNRNYIFMFTIMLMLTYPVPIFMDFYHGNFVQQSNFSTDYMLLFYPLTIVILIIVPFFVFNYMTKKRSVDFIHSLPISRSELFITNALAALLIVLIPFTIVYWSGTILSYFTSTNTFQWDQLSIYVRSILVFGSIQIPTIFVIMNTGTLSDSVIYSLMLFVVPFIAYIALSDFASTYLLGFTGLSAVNILVYISPATYLISIILPPSVGLHYNVLSALWLVLGLVGYAVSCSAYRHWKSEYSERPFNNDYFYPLVASLFTTLVFIFTMALFSIDTQTPLRFLSPRKLVFPILLTYVFYVVLDFIRNRSAKFILSATKQFTYIIIFSLSLSTILFVTQGFGYAWNIPELENTSSIKVKLEEFYEGYQETSYDIPEKNFEEVLSIHNDLVSKFKKANTFFSEDQVSLNNYAARITFQYQLKNGNKMKRTFNVPSDFFDDIYEVRQLPSVMVQSQGFLKGEAILNPKMTSIQDDTQLTLSDDDLAQFRTLYLQDLETISESPEKDNSSKIRYVFRYQITQGYEPYQNTNYDQDYEYGYKQLYVDDQFIETLAFLKTLEHKELNSTYYMMEIPAYDTAPFNVHSVHRYFEDFEVLNKLDDETFINKTLNNSLNFNPDKTMNGYLISMTGKDINYSIAIYE